MTESTNGTTVPPHLFPAVEGGDRVGPGLYALADDYRRQRQLALALMLRQSPSVLIH